MKVLLPIDGSDCAEHTLSWVAHTFDSSKVNYYLLFVIPVFPRMIQDEYEIADAERILQHARRSLETQGATVINAVHISGDPVEKICAYADEIVADQVVIGTHGRTGLARIIMGSTAQAILERCKHPVVIHRNVPPPGGKQASS